MQMDSNVFNRKSQLIAIGTFCLIVVYPLLFVWQGLDFTDMGYTLTGYQQFLSAPEGVSGQLANWGAVGIGWLVSRASGDLGVVAFKIAMVLVNWLTLWLVYLLVREHVSPNRQFLLPLVLFGTLAYVTKTGGEWIDYNNLTAFFFVLTGFCLYRGLTRASLVWIGLSGFFAAFNLFVRFPNLLGISLGFLIFVWGWVTRNRLPTTLVSGLAFVVGAALALSTTLLLIYGAGHWPYYLGGLRRILGMATNAESHHSSELLLSLFVRDHFRALAAGLLALLSAYVAATFLRRGNRLIVASAVCALAILAVPVLRYSNSWRWLVTGTVYLGLVGGTICGLRQDARLMLLCLLAGCILVMAPLGSNNGMYNSVYGSWLAIPTLFVLVTESLPFQQGRLVWRFVSLHVGSIRLMAIMMAGALLVFSVTQKTRSTYRDHPNRFMMTYPIKARLLTGVFTTQARARVISELLTELDNHVKPGDVILTYNSIPTVHYLTQTVPYLGISWPMLSLPTTNRAELEHRATRSLPVVIVRATGSTWNGHWPLGSRKLSRSAHDACNRGVFREFEGQHHYTVFWRNEFFEILAQGNTRKDPTGDP